MLCSLYFCGMFQASYYSSKSSTNLSVSPSLSFIRTMYARNSGSLEQKTLCLFSRSAYISLNVWRHLVRFSLLILGSNTIMSSSHSRSEQYMWKRAHFSISPATSIVHNCCCVMSCKNMHCQFLTFELQSQMKSLCISRNIFHPFNLINKNNVTCGLQSVIALQACCTIIHITFI